MAAGLIASPAQPRCLIGTLLRDSLLIDVISAVVVMAGRTIG